MFKIFHDIYSPLLLFFHFLIYQYPPKYQSFIKTHVN